MPKVLHVLEPGVFLVENYHDFPQYELIHYSIRELAYVVATPEAAPRYRAKLDDETEQMLRSYLRNPAEPRERRTKAFEFIVRLRMEQKRPLYEQRIEAFRDACNGTYLPELAAA